MSTKQKITPENRSRRYGRVLVPRLARNATMRFCSATRVASVRRCRSSTYRTTLCARAPMLY